MCLVVSLTHDGIDRKHDMGCFILFFQIPVFNLTLNLKSIVWAGMCASCCLTIITNVCLSKEKKVILTFLFITTSCVILLSQIKCLKLFKLSFPS